MDIDGFRKLFEEKKGCALTEEDDQFLSNLSIKEMVEIWDMIKEEKDWEAEVQARKKLQHCQREDAEETSNGISPAKVRQDQGTGDEITLPKSSEVAVDPSNDQSLEGASADTPIYGMAIDDNDDDSADRRTTREQRKEEYFREQRDRERHIQEEVERRLQEEIQRRLEVEVARRLQMNQIDADGMTHFDEKKELQLQVEQQLQAEVGERIAIIEECQKEPLSPAAPRPEPADAAQAADGATGSQSAKKRRPPLHETPNAKRKRSSPTMAESVLKYQKRTPPRFRSAPRAPSVGPTPRSTEAAHPPRAAVKLVPAGMRSTAAPSKPSATAKHTQPKPFNFSTDRRASQRLSVMAPPAPLLPQAKRPSQSLVSRPSQSAAPLAPPTAVPRPTVPRPFRLSISNRSSSLAIPPKVEPAAPFRATPLNRKMFATVGEVGVPRVVKRESTVPQDFGFMKRELEKQKLRAAAKKETPSDGKENVATHNVLVPTATEASLKRPRAADALAKAMLPPPPKRPRTCAASQPNPQPAQV